VDLHTVAELRPGRPTDGWRPGDAWLAGGTWLFSEPQTHLRRLFDLTELGWEPLRTAPDGSLEIAATCTVAELARHPHPLFLGCCRAFLASFKVWNVATVGGNLCAGLPAGPMISLTAGLDGRCLLIAPDGTERTVPVTGFVVGDGRTVLRAGELLRSVTLPAAALARRACLRQASLHPLGRSAALVVGTREQGGELALTVTAATARPRRLRFAGVPGAGELAAALDAEIPDGGWFDDVHGDPDWRRHLTHRLAGEVVRELADPGPRGAGEPGRGR
jgi:CO/xanthine dehydrogenase FAD-binding subunit